MNEATKRIGKTLRKLGGNWLETKTRKCFKKGGKEENKKYPIIFHLLQAIVSIDSLQLLLLKNTI